jgi:hypothetical protein
VASIWRAAFANASSKFLSSWLTFFPGASPKT